MSKTPISVLLTFFCLIVSAVLLVCTLPANPEDPKNAQFNAVFTTSDGRINPHSVIDTVGKKLKIGVALTLPANFDSIHLVVSKEGETEFETTFKGYSATKRADTVWTEYVFNSVGIRTALFTPYTSLDRPAINANIEIVSPAHAANIAPRWSIDTLSISLNDTASYSLKLSDICSDMNGDAVTYTLLPGTPAGDTVTGAIYTFTASSAACGTHHVTVSACDPDGAADTLVIKLTIAHSAVDTVPPSITLISPATESAVSIADSVTIAVICTDASGIASVDAVMDDNKFPASFTGGQYKMIVNGLKKGIDNTIVIAAVDASANANKATKTIIVTFNQPCHVIYDGNGNTGGTVPVDDDRYENGAIVTVKGNTGKLEKSGFTFTGWNTVADGSGIEYKAGLPLSWEPTALRSMHNGPSGGLQSPISATAAPMAMSLIRHSLIPVPS